MKIKRIGVELEGGWYERPSIRLYSDGSVSVEAEYTGEIHYDHSDIEQVIRFIENFYPDAVNSSCGFHIHLSFKNKLSYMKLMSREFFDKFYEFMRTWGKDHNILEGSSFWKRLRNDNHYCRATYNPDKQCYVSNKVYERYCGINYCYTLHGTLEFRVPPMFKKKDLAIILLKDLVNFVEGYLDSCPKEKRLAIEIKDETEIKDYYKIEEEI